MSKPAFEVIRSDGHAFRIWADGQTEGFGDVSAVVINRIPVLIAEAAAEKLASAAIGAPVPPAGYSQMPAGMRCRCIKSWVDAAGNAYCCKGSISARRGEFLHGASADWAGS